MNQKALEPSLFDPPEDMEPIDFMVGEDLLERDTGRGFLAKGSAEPGIEKNITSSAALDPVVVMDNLDFPRLAIKGDFSPIGESVAGDGFHIDPF
jgi:hypothetical protein